MSDKRPLWAEILQNQSRNTHSDKEALERLARYAARENARAEHLQRVLGQVAATLETNAGKSEEWNELLTNLTLFIRGGINEANQLAFRAQKEGEAGGIRH